MIIKNEQPYMNIVDRNRVAKKKALAGLLAAMSVDEIKAVKAKQKVKRTERLDKLAKRRKRKVRFVFCILIQISVEN
jgi:hypothetical protein